MQTQRAMRGPIPWHDGPARITLNGRSAGDRFAGQLGSILHRLRITHLRFSLARLWLPAQETGRHETSARIADQLEAACVLAGVMADDSVAAAFLGPRPSGACADDLEVARIAQRCCRPLRSLGDAATGARLAVIHRWTDEVVDLQSLIADLKSADPIALQSAYLS